MAKQAKRAKPEQLSLPGFDPVEPKAYAVGGCIDLNTRKYAAEYATWFSMVYRCENPEFAVFRKYGGKGIKVCPEWRRSFAAFVRDMGRRPDGMTLDRINSSGDYEPANCRWLDAGENSRRATAKRLGSHKSMAEASTALSGAACLVSRRCRVGWCEEHAVTLPKGSRRPADCEKCSKRKEKSK